MFHKLHCIKGRGVGGEGRTVVTVNHHTAAGYLNCGWINLISGLVPANISPLNPTDATSRRFTARFSLKADRRETGIEERQSIKPTGSSLSLSLSLCYPLYVPGLYMYPVRVKGVNAHRRCRRDYNTHRAGMSRDWCMS